MRTLRLARLAAASLLALGCPGEDEARRGDFPLQVTAYGAHWMDLAWGPTGRAYDRYTVWVDGAAYHGGPGAERSLRVTGLTDGARHCARVVVADLLGLVATASDEACVRTPVDQPPSAPADVIAVARSPARVELSWTGAIDDTGPVRYAVACGEASVTTEEGATAAALDGLAAGARHCCTVTAVDGWEHRTASAPACLDTPPDLQPPTAPGALRVARGGDTALRVTWEASGDDGWVAAYRVLRDGADVARTGATEHVDQALARRTQYCYSVVAIDTGGNASAPAGPECLTTSWTVSPVADGLWGLDGLGLAELPGGDVRLVASAGRLWSARRTAGAWAAADVAPVAGRAGVAFAGDAVHVAFGAPALTYGTDAGGAWRLETVDATASPDLPPAVALAADGTPHVVFADGSALRHAARGGAGWSLETVADDGVAAPYASCGVAAAFDAAGRLHVASCLPRSAAALVTSVRHAVRDAGGWTATVLDEASPASAPALAVGPDGAVHVLYTGRSVEAASRCGWAAPLRRAVLRGGEWSLETVDPLALGSPALALDPAGVPNAAYVGNCTELRHAVAADGVAWRTSILGTGVTAGDELRLALGAGGAAYVAWAFEYTDRWGGHGELWLLEAR